LVSKIALEEHFLCPGYEGYWATTVGGVAPDALRRISARLSDFGDSRIEAMDNGGILKAVLSLAGPGVQSEPDRAVAIRMAATANDFLAREIQKRPDRYAGFGHLPMQDPAAAADELERCVRDLGFCGAMINGHTNGQYLDHPSLAAFWERASALRAPVYIHPTPPHPAVMDAYFKDYPVLSGAPLGFTLETLTHTYRLILSGLFDEFPALKIIVGHLGETAPFLLWRTTDTLGRRIKMPRAFGDYYRTHFWLTTSGAFSDAALTCSIAEMGVERIMFSIDWPFQENLPGRKWLDAAPVSEPDRAAIFGGNAQKLLKL